ncbi:cyclic lactone autoinducer peptide [Metaclostridioides mangenotii]|nr:cyclic lactone autoinducer peptide [Clostridioides mangenotii]
MKMVIKFLLGKLETLAVRSLSISANTTCSWLNHQPKIPNEIHKYKVR